MSDANRLEQRLNEDLKTAMREKDALRRSVIQMIRSQILLEKKMGKGVDTVPDERVIQLVQSHTKKLEDALESARKAERADLVETTEREIEIARGYLPEPLSDEELQRIVESTVAAQGETGPKVMGAVMKAVMTEAGGRADGKRVQQAVRSALGIG